MSALGHDWYTHWDLTHMPARRAVVEHDIRVLQLGHDRNFPLERYDALRDVLLAMSLVAYGSYTHWDMTRTRILADSCTCVTCSSVPHRRTSFTANISPESVLIASKTQPNAPRPSIFFIAQLEPTFASAQGGCSGGGVGLDFRR